MANVSESVVRRELRLLWSIRIFMLRVAGVPAIGALAYGVFLAVGSRRAWGIEVADALLLAWALGIVILLLRRVRSWTALAAISVVFPTIACLILPNPQQPIGLFVGVGLNTMYAFARTRCTFLGCCDIPRQFQRGKVVERRWHLGQVEIAASTCLAALGVWALTMTQVGLPLVVAHGFLRVGVTHIRAASNTERRRSNYLLLTTALAELIMP